MPGEKVGDLARKVAAVVDLRAVDGEDRVAVLQAGFGRRARRGHVIDQRALGLAEPEARRHVLVDVLDPDAEPAALDGAGCLELFHDIGCGLGGNGESDADVAARGAVDGGVDAHHLAVEVERRAAGVALVHGSVDLHVIVGTRPDVATLCGDDAGRDGAAQSERIADCDDPIADPRHAARELDVREGLAAGLDLEQCQIGALIGADQLGVILVLFWSKLTWILVALSITWLLVTT